jgi:hypothetical protein
MNNLQYEKLKNTVERLCLDAIEAQKKRECSIGYGLDDYTEGRIVGCAALARKILREIRN